MVFSLLSQPNLTLPYLGTKLNLNISKPDRVHFRTPICSMDASAGGNLKFPRMNTWDPYKRLGISTDASEEEIWGSRNFLMQEYEGHERSVEFIEAAFEKLLMTSFKQRKKTKFNVKSRLKNKVEESPSWVKNLFGFIELPPAEVILRRLEPGV